MAEQLEHIQSPALIERLDEFLERPRFDPHGDPIPDAQGRFLANKRALLSELKAAERGTVVGVQEHSPAFLQYLDRMGLNLGAKLQVTEVFEFDQSIRILLNEEQDLTISCKVSQNIFVQKTK